MLLSWIPRNPQAQQTFRYLHNRSPLPQEPFGSSSSTLIVGTVVAGCVALYGYEQFQEMEIKNGSRKAYGALQNVKKHFVLSLDNIREGRYYVILTSAFAHVNGTHLLVNMMALWGFGKTTVQLFGLRHFAMIWWGSAALGSILQLEYWKKFERPGLKYESVGASGGVFGIMSALSFVYPQMRVWLVVIPMTLRMCMTISVALSVGAIKEGWLPQIGHVNHLGGMAFGFVYWIVALRRGRFRSPF